MISYGVNQRQNKYTVTKLGVSHLNELFLCLYTNSIPIKAKTHKRSNMLFGPLLMLSLYLESKAPFIWLHHILLPSRMSHSWVIGVCSRGEYTPPVWMSQTIGNFAPVLDQASSHYLILSHSAKILPSSHDASVWDSYFLLILHSTLTSFPV